jgi:hypothetical protein
LCATKLEFFFTRAITSSATLEKLIVSHDLEEGSNVVIHSGDVKIATYVAGSLKPFVVNGFDEVAIGHLCEFLCGHDLLLENRMAVLEIRKDVNIRQKK